VQWRKSTIFRLDQEETGQTTLFGSWYCKWSKRNRDSWVKYVEPDPRDTGSVLSTSDRAQDTAGQQTAPKATSGS
jgi:hypothetical protein